MEQSKFYQIKNITEHEYTLAGCDGSVIARPIQDINKSASAFTIKDAKDGDVLAVDWHIHNDSWEKIIIFKKYHHNGVKGLLSSPCVEGYGNTFKNGKLALSEEVPYFSKTWTAYLHPATKEQCDLLFRKMKEAGYTFDFEKKELKKIEQKPAWSEEDEDKLNKIIDLVSNYINDEVPGDMTYEEHKNFYIKHINWLKSLKERMKGE